MLKDERLGKQSNRLSGGDAEIQQWRSVRTSYINICQEWQTYSGPCHRPIRRAGCVPKLFPAVFPIILVWSNLHNPKGLSRLTLRSFQVYEQYGVGKAWRLNTRKKKAISFPRLGIAAQNLPLEFANTNPVQATQHSTVAASPPPIGLVKS